MKVLLLILLLVLPVTARQHSKPRCPAVTRATKSHNLDSYIQNPDKYEEKAPAAGVRYASLGEVFNGLVVSGPRGDYMEIWLDTPDRYTRRGSDSAVTLKIPREHLPPEWADAITADILKAKWTKPDGGLMPVAGCSTRSITFWRSERKKPESQRKRFEWPEDCKPDSYNKLSAHLTEIRQFMFDNWDKVVGEVRGRE